jgi:hypothetical protein
VTVAISASIEEDRPPAEVFTYVTDPSRFSERQKGVVGGHMATTLLTRSEIGASPCGAWDSPTDPSPGH